MTEKSSRFITGTCLIVAVVAITVVMLALCHQLHG